MQEAQFISGKHIALEEGAIHKPTQSLHSEGGLSTASQVSIPKRGKRVMVFEAVFSKDVNNQIPNMHAFFLSRGILKNEDFYQ